ncbi:MAG: hypothetical protein IT338_11200 [Thermomicrobiales bacterium]|nr:hypothetical protein [Thermomicrobiales bacterium]
MATNQGTGTRDVTYDLISVIYHALQGAQTYQIYANDADGDVASFFRDVQQQNEQIANRAKSLLAKQLSQSGSGSDQGRGRS